jgi:uncharacterized membrane protein
MKRNIGTVDRVVRLLTAAVIIILGITGVISGALLIVLGIVAAAFIITGILGLCPIYLLFRLSTRRN